MANECVLYDRACTGCGECNICDLDSSKQCDSCGKCLEDTEDYRSLNIDEFMQIQEERELVKKGRSE